MQRHGAIRGGSLCVLMPVDRMIEPAANPVVGHTSKYSMNIAVRIRTSTANDAFGSPASKSFGIIESLSDAVLRT